MKGTLSKDRRITIPNEVISQISFKPGSPVSITTKDGKIIIEEYNENNADETEAKTKSAKKPSTGSSIVIESNIQDLKMYAKPILSPCGKVVRSKRKYIDKFCEICKGQLSTENCKYIEPETKPLTKTTKNKNKDVINSIKENTQKLNNKIDNKIDQTNFHDGSTSIQPIILSGNKLIPCECCGQLFNRGFMLNDEEFYCKECLKLDFKKYIQSRRNS